MGLFEKICLGSMILVLVVLFSGLGTMMGSLLLCPMERWNEVRVYDDVYRARVPFGEFWVETTGQGRFLFGSGRIDIHSDVSEFYPVKYWVNGELRSIMLNAEETPIIVDGTFRIERTQQYRRQPSFFLIWDMSTTHLMKTTWRIYVPFVPNVNQTMTTDWR